MSLKELDHVQERDVALSYLCGVSPECISDNWDVSYPTARYIAGEHSNQWNDSLIDFYKQTSPWQRTRNSAHLYMAFREKDIPNQDLVVLKRDRKAFKSIKNDIYDKQTEEIAENLLLDKFLVPSDGFELLLNDIFGKRTSESIIEPILLEELYGEYSNEKFSLKGVYENVLNNLTEKIKEGGLSITPRKKEVIYDSIKTLLPREGSVILSLYDKKLTLKATGKECGGVSIERIRQIRNKSLRKLRHSTRTRKLRILNSLATDQDVDRYISDFDKLWERQKWYNELYPAIKEEVLRDMLPEKISVYLSKKGIPLNQEIQSMPIDDLGLSVRSRNGLLNLGVTNLGELLNKTEIEFLKGRNIGRSSLNEVKEVLSELGFSFKA